ncbi:hypothetical protein [Serpens gallinarum]|uniref:Uncharacterized protein n=1 Tax=Serpens gallinarum TaxID=2763075 RepID=A0ABR8TRY6_9PSED|nr:hypothetical protein [Serpens gallinarum]MBD7978515.1 hypothetical protein [Serpens gallinarum]
MPTIETCGSEAKRTEFTYRGNARDGITLEFESGDFDINSQTIAAVIDHFRGQTVRGGFSMTNPPLGGVGAFLQQQGGGLTPRHASFLCAALQHEGLVDCVLDGNAVVVTFNA